MNWAILILAFSSAAPPAGGRPPLLVAAAASTRPALEEVSREFERREGIGVSVSYAASGILERQIENGAPYDLLFAADEATIDRLAAKRMLDARTRTVYARGRLVLAASRTSDPSLRALADLAGVRMRRLALPNPETAPYGAAARQALDRLGLWRAVAGRVVLAENVRDALRYAETGDADFAFAALPEARQTGLRLIEVPESSHLPILQAAAAAASSGRPELARRFLGFAAGPEGRRIWERWGYGDP